MADIGIGSSVVLSPSITTVVRNNEDGFHLHCAECGKPIVKRAGHGRYCNASCRMAYHRKRRYGRVAVKKNAAQMELFT